MSTQPEQFDDAALKAALKRVCGQESAPPALRERVAALLAQEQPRPIPASPDYPSLPLNWWRRPLWRLAAAVFILALAGVVYHQSMQRGGQQIIRPTALAALVEDHDRCCEHASSITAESARLVGQTIRQQLNQPVLAPDLTADGWRFRGGAVCRVDGKNSAHLVFARGSQMLSIFSVPAFDGSKDAGFCSNEISGHLTAAVVKSGELYCVVGHCPRGGLKHDEIRQILERRLTDSLVVASLTPSR